jgi:hypothetical protein
MPVAIEVLATVSPISPMTSLPGVLRAHPLFLNTITHLHRGRPMPDREEQGRSPPPDPW